VRLQQVIHVVDHGLVEVDRGRPFDIGERRVLPQDPSDALRLISPGLTLVAPTEVREERRNALADDLAQQGQVPRPFRLLLDQLLRLGRLALGRHPPEPEGLYRSSALGLTNPGRFAGLVSFAGKTAKQITDRP
jgi:hypothetical protein